MSKYLGDWSEEKDMIKDFQDHYYSDEEVKEEDRVDLSNHTVLLAYYLYEDYSGDAFVLLKDKEGNLFEVNGGHCSCYGLEGQWSLEATTKEALLHRVENGQLGSGYGWNDDGSKNTFANELKEVLNDNS